MNIEAQKFTVELSYGELFSIAWDLKISLERSLKDHWINHQNNWKTGEEQRLLMIKTMFLNLARPELYEEIDKKANAIFQEFNDKKS